MKAGKPGSWSEPARTLPPNTLCGGNVNVGRAGEHNIIKFVFGSMECCLAELRVD